MGQTQSSLNTKHSDKTAIILTSFPHQNYLPSRPQFQRQMTIVKKEDVTPNSKLIQEDNAKK